MLYINKYDDKKSVSSFFVFVMLRF